jgi:hypothetical protein
MLDSMLAGAGKDIARVLVEEGAGRPEINCILAGIVFSEMPVSEVQMEVMARSFRCR